MVRLIPPCSLALVPIQTWKHQTWSIQASVLIQAWINNKASPTRTCFKFEFNFQTMARRNPVLNLLLFDPFIPPLPFLYVRYFILLPDKGTKIRSKKNVLEDFSDERSECLNWIVRIYNLTNIYLKYEGKGRLY